FTGEKSYSAANDQFSDKMAAIGFAPERANRYAYHLGVAGGAACTLWENRDVPIVTTGGNADCIDFDLYKFSATLMPANLDVTANSAQGVVAFVPGATGEVIPLGTHSVSTLDNLGSWSADCYGQIDNDPYLDVHFVANSPVPVIAA